MRWPVALAIIGIATGIVGGVASLYLPGVPQWVWGSVFWSGIATIIAAILWAVWPSSSRNMASREHLLLPVWRLESINLRKPPFIFVMSLKKAATIAYNRTRGSAAAEIAERPINDTANPYNWFATALTDRSDKKCRLFGELPSTKWLREIPEADVRSGHIEQDGFILKTLGHPTRVYENIHILRTDFRRRLKEIKGWG